MILKEYIYSMTFDVAEDKNFTFVDREAALPQYSQINAVDTSSLPRLLTMSLSHLYLYIKLYTYIFYICILT